MAMQYIFLITLSRIDWLGGLALPRGGYVLNYQGIRKLVAGKSFIKLRLNEIDCIWPVGQVA